MSVSCIQRVFPLEWLWEDGVVGTLAQVALVRQGKDFALGKMPVKTENRW